MKKVVSLALMIAICLACLVSCILIPHEHTSEMQITEEGHCEVYTCGCPSTEIIEMHADNDFDGLCDICEYTMCKDSSSHQKYICKNADGHWWVYPCGCSHPKSEVEPHIDGDGDSYCDICRYYMPEAVVLSDIEAWLKIIIAEETIAVTTWYSDGALGCGLKEKVTVTDKDDIAKIIESYKNLEIFPLDPNVSYDILPDSFRVIFTTESGYHQLMVNGGFMFTHKYGTYNVSYDMSNVPEIDGYESSEVSYMFDVFYGYNQDATVFDLCGGLVCKIDNISDLEFVESEYLAENMPLYIIETGVGIVTVYSERYFEYEGVCYKLVNGDFLELVKIWSGEDFNVEVYNARNWFYENLDSTYKAGEIVYIKIKKATDIGIVIVVNGEKLEMTGEDESYWEYAFTMPESDITVCFNTYDGFLPHENYGKLCESYILDDPYIGSTYVMEYYGEFESGAIVAMMGGGYYTGALWDEMIDGIVIRYYNGNRILVLYEDVFYTLTEAYEFGYLTIDDIAHIAYKKATSR